ncbi:unnamed protein product [Gulo gulo]|uniref:Uncharacterized protein n=1 Tax=Gulo gulo TaxID=48420 RepID=A0A9X9LDM9_GULGU|nr:unnamed protein product [Gulo gulo]
MSTHSVFSVQQISSFYWFFKTSSSELLLIERGWETLAQTLLCLPENIW